MWHGGCHFLPCRRTPTALVIPQPALTGQAMAPVLPPHFTESRFGSPRLVPSGPRLLKVTTGLLMSFLQDVCDLENNRRTLQ